MILMVACVHAEGGGSIDIMEVRSDLVANTSLALGGILLNVRPGGRASAYHTLSTAPPVYYICSIYTMQHGVCS